MITAADAAITDEYIREWRASKSPLSRNHAYLCAIALGETEADYGACSRTEARRKLAAIVYAKESK